MLLEALEYLEEQSKLRNRRRFTASTQFTAAVPVIENPAVTDKIVRAVQIPYYIDPSTGEPWDPYRSNSPRSKRKAKLNRLRAVLP